MPWVDPFHRSQSITGDCLRHSDLEHSHHCGRNVGLNPYVFLSVWVTLTESFSLLGLSFFICKMKTENYLNVMEV